MKNSEIVHIWANNYTSFGKCGNIKFDSDGIYSYNLMIGAFRTPDVVFVDRIPHSHTTANHQSKIISAVCHKQYFVYNDIPDVISDIDYIHIPPNRVDPNLVWNQYHAIYKALLERAKVKKYNRTLPYTLQLISAYATKANHLSNVFDLSQTCLDTDISDDMQTAIDDINKKAELAKIKKFDKFKKDRVKWLNGEINTYPDASINDIVLRVSPTDPTKVETSRGAFVPLSVCKRLYSSFIAQSMPDDKTVGMYTLTTIQPQFIQIGCHTISADELHRFATVINIR
jgi:hypothetical protein